MDIILSAEEIEKNYEIFISYIENYISEPRKTIITNFYNSIQERIMFMPASSKDFHHNCFPGGYIDHVNRVVELALELKNLWFKFGAIDDKFTDEELVFAALHHDLGKIGSIEEEMYIIQEDEWRKKNLGEYYYFNKNVEFLTVPDRSLFLLQSLNIPLTYNEYIAIKTHDGLYDDANKPYYISYNPDSKPLHSMNYILHQADLAAARIEYENHYLRSGKNIKSKNSKVIKKEPKVIKTLENKKSNKLMNIIDNL